MKYRIEAVMKSNRTHHQASREDVKERARDFESLGPHVDPDHHARRVLDAFFDIVADLGRQRIEGEGPPFSDGRFFLQPDLDIAIKIRKLPPY